MQRKSFGRMSCPIARSLERVGEWWSILILRDALHGLTRFDQFQKSLEIAPNMLTRRLNALVDAGLLARRRYHQHPPRDEYVLTARGRDFQPVLHALLAWGNRHFAPEGASVLLVDAASGAPAGTARGTDRFDLAAACVAERAGDAGAGRDRPDRDVVDRAARHRRARRHGARLSRRHADADDIRRRDGRRHLVRGRARSRRRTAR